MMTWNDILDIELRNKDNQDVATLVAAIRAGNFDDVFRQAVTECVEDIDATGYEHVEDGKLLKDNRHWKRLITLCEI